MSWSWGWHPSSADSTALLAILNIEAPISRALIVSLVVYIEP